MRRIGLAVIFALGVFVRPLMPNTQGIGFLRDWTPVGIIVLE